MTVLDDIVAGVRADLAERAASRSLDDVLRAIAEQPPARPVLPRLTGPELAVIAEVKRRSPSKGELSEIPDPAALAQAYAAGGAAAISVLTEARRFGGSLVDLDQVRAKVDIPVLRKDFMVDEYQLYEARAHGSDLVLLIVAALDDAQLARLHAIATELHLTALVETHTLEEVDRALAIGAQIIGVNNRNLKTLDVDLATFAPLAARVDSAAVVVAESGIGGPADAARLAAEGADALLVGEALVRDGSPTERVAELRAAADPIP
ncbi:MAG: indole-3-glycerol phosphate synthase TrpC [Arachnia sp.]